MSIHPTNGVPPSQANRAYCPEHPSQCDLYYGTNPCLQQIDIDALNALISNVRRVIDECGSYDCASLDALFEAIKCIVCKYAFTMEDVDPPENGSEEIIEEITNPDGSTTFCRTIKDEDPCPAVWFNRVSGCVFFWDRRDKQWRKPSDGHHIGPCSDYENGLIQACDVTWYQTDKQRTATRCGDIWITSQIGDEGCVFAPPPNPTDSVAGDIRWLAQDGNTPPSFSVMMSLSADERGALQDLSFLQDAVDGATIVEDDVVFIALDYGGSIALDSLTISPAQDTGFSSSWAHGSGTPVQGTVTNRTYGSDDGSSWTLLPGQSISGAGSNVQSVYVQSTNTTAYRYYGFAMDFATGSSDINIVEFRMVGAPPA